MAKKKTASKADSTPTFEASLASLEQIVSELESGELGLEQSLDAYEKGIQRLKECHQHLKAAERRVEQLSGFDAEGNPILEPLDDTPTANDRSAGEKSSGSRARRKSDLEDVDPGLF